MPFGQPFVFHRMQERNVCVSFPLLRLVQLVVDNNRSDTPALQPRVDHRDAGETVQVRLEPERHDDDRLMTEVHKRPRQLPLVRTEVAIVEVRELLQPVQALHQRTL